MKSVNRHDFSSRSWGTWPGGKNVAHSLPQKSDRALSAARTRVFATGSEIVDAYQKVL
jgi:hypothetical protein